MFARYLNSELGRIHARLFTFASLAFVTFFVLGFLTIR